VKRVVTAIILIPLVVIALFKAPLWLFTLLVFGVAVLAAHEYFGIVKAQGFRPFEVASYLLLTLTFPVIVFMGLWMMGQPNDPKTLWMMRVGEFRVFWFGAPVVLLGGALLFLLLGLRRDPLSQALPDAASSYLLIPYIGWTLVLLPILRIPANGSLYLLCLMLLVWCGDIAAYYVGRAIGKHKLAPRISPGKSWEGAIASVLGAVVVGVVVMHFIDPIADRFRSLHLLSTTRSITQYPAPPVKSDPVPLWFAALFAIAVNVSAQLGDLVESALKRGAGVKDSGTLLPGHGGVLDRIDALLFALPVGLIFYLCGFVFYFANV
jgi:phosphatidate cytidylyltransferase